MQTYHRRRHRLLWAIVAVVVAVALIIALSNRDPVRSLLNPPDKPVFSDR